MGRILALDPGTRRVGLALSDPGRTVSSPLGVWAYNRAFWGRIRRLVLSERIDLIVVGRPRTLEGKLGKAAATAETFAEEVRRATELPVELEDETATTVLAEERERIHRQTRRPTELDALAAQIILEGYLARIR